MIEKSVFMPLTVDELTEIDGGSTKVVAIVAGILTVVFLVAGTITGSAWCYAAASACGLVSAWCAVAPFI